jgi:hypothetical protein
MYDYRAELFFAVILKIVISEISHECINTQWAGVLFGNKILVLFYI